jgi:flagellin
MSTPISHQTARDLAANLSRLQPLVDASVARVSTGSRLDKPSRDVPGLSTAAKLESEQSRWDAVGVNLQNGTSRLQVTSDHLRILNQVVTRLSELAVLRTNPVQGQDDQQLYETEALALQQQLRQTVGGTTSEVGGTADVGAPLGRFNGRDLFGPDEGETLAVGLRADEVAALPVVNLRTGAMGQLIQQDAAGAFTWDITSPTDVARLNEALDQIGAGQAQVGALQSRLSLAGERRITEQTNGEAALSSVRDTDIARETTVQTRLQILMEGHTAMIAQAREATAKLLPLLQR